MAIVHRASLVLCLLGVIFSFYISDVFTNGGHAWGYAIGLLTVCQFLFLSVCMLCAWWSAPRCSTFRDVRGLLIVAILARLICLPVAPYTSNDIDRYLFDGKIALAGYDPYQVTHEAPELRELREIWQPPEEHVQYPTLYPPLSLALFSFAAISGADVAHLVWKMLVTIAGVLTVLVMARVLQRMNRLQHLSLVALSPLLILETGIGAHVNAFSALFVALCLYYLQAKQMAVSGFFIGLGALIKILPIALLLPLVLGQKRLRPSVTLAGAAGITVVVGYGIALFVGLVPVGSIGTLFEKWRFGSPLYSLLSATLSPVQAALMAVACIVAGAVVIAWHALRQPAAIDITSPLLVYALALILLFSPVVFPWYLMALVPLVAVAPRPAIIVWMCTIGLTYEVLSGLHGAGQWQPAVWPLAVMFLGFVLGAALEFRARANQQQASRALPVPL